MVQPDSKNRNLYFTYDEIEEALENYQELYRNKKIKEKIPYFQWKELKNSTRGVVVDETYTNSEKWTKTLKFYKVGKYELLEFIGEFVEGKDEFYHFFYHNYLINNFNYSFANEYINKGEEEMLLSEKSNYYDTSTSSNQYTDYSVWDAYRNAPLANATASISYDMSEMAESLQKLTKTVDKLKEDKKENDNMTGFNFDFGPCTGDKVRMSVYGLAVQNARGEWQSYDEKTGQVMNVDLLNFDGRKFMYKVPVAVSAVEKGDIVIHNCLPMIVLDNDDTGLIVVDVKAGEEKKILPVKSPFGFDFITKIVSLFNAFSDAPTPDAPFGNFLPFLMMGENGKDVDPFAMCLMMQQTGGAATNLFNNPMMMYFLMKDNKSGNDWFLPMMLMNQSPAQQKTARK
jgi:hypothetical protein